VASIGNTHAWAKSGVMIREALTADSRHALMAASVGKGYAFQRRLETGGLSVHTSGGAGTPPGWVRLVRTGDRFDAYRSADGASWTLVGSETIVMGSTVYAGIAVTSHNGSVLTTSVVDSFKVTAAAATNGAPAVTITSPSAAATFTMPAAVTIAASATDPENRMSAVDFYANDTLIARDTTAPYSVPWTPSAAGSYSLTATAYDADGGSSTSASVTVTVEAENSPPTVTLTEPANGASYTAPATITITATASDPEGQLARVEFYNGPTLVGSDTSAPYSFSWTNVTAGSYTLSAKAIDANGGSATSASVSVTVAAANAPPSATLTAPANGASYPAPATITITASASDPEGQLARVEFYNGSALLGSDTSAPYTFTWANVLEGSYTLSAKAIDAAGASATTAAVTVAVAVAPQSTPPRYVVFTASSDHAANVTSYFFEVFTSGANPGSATPVAAADLGKPVPAANGDITADQATLFSNLAAGNYVATVTAVGPGGRTRSAAVTFTR